MNRDELHILIERYFDGDTTPEEEKSLLATLLSMPPGDEEADEALAVMGYARLKPRKEIAVRRRNFTGIAAAAVAMVLVAFGLTLYFSTPHIDAGECYAYVGGERIESEEVIRALMADQLEEMSEASEDVSRQITDDLDDFRGLFDSEMP